MIHALLITLTLAGRPVVQPPPRAAVNVLELGAIADGLTDCAPAIQGAIDRVSKSGGEVIIPAAEKPYLIRSGLTIAADGVVIMGEGATVRFADGAMNGEVVDCIRVVGTADDPVENVTITGLTIDANYWAQPGSFDPRGIGFGYSRRVLVDRVTITGAFIGLTFGAGVSESEARDCVVTRWYDAAYQADGEGVSGSCHGVTFTRCTARDSLDERAGGPPGSRDRAFAIEDGAHGVSLVECAVNRCGGNGFSVRNHTTGNPVATTAVRFVRCRADDVSRDAFRVIGGAYPNT
ncbi:MAG: hypothetical protein K8E66_03410, partial [Phycisphaerales bacterium]|nr:hypothetical protein [Phycisphaerales bacterium]